MAKQTLKLSPRYKRIFDSGQRQKELKLVIFKTAQFVVGQSEENKLTGSIPPSGAAIDTVPLAAGFSKWRSRGNKTTKVYPDYTDKYEEFKDEQGLDNWGIKSGNLFKQILIKPKIRVTAKGFRISTGKGVAQEYAKFVNDKREFMVINSTGRRNIIRFIQKQLIRAFGKPGATS